MMAICIGVGEIWAGDVGNEGEKLKKWKGSKFYYRGENNFDNCM